MAVVTGAILAGNASPAAVSDQYLVVQIAGVVLIYRVSGDMVYTDRVTPVMGRLAGDLIRRLREVEQPE